MNQLIQNWRERLARSGEARLAAAYLAVVTVATVAVYAFTLPVRERMRTAFEASTYYFLWAIVIAWLVILAALLREKKPDWKAFARQNAIGAALSIALTTGVFFSCQPYLRVLADEANLVDVSRVMTYEKKTAQATMGVYYYRNFNASYYESPPKKAVLYPFVVNLVHTATGVRLENAYAVNFIVLVLILCMVFYFIRRLFGAVWGVGTVLLVAAQPVVTQSATSAGFDLFTAFIFFINAIGLWVYLGKPSPLRLAFVATNLLLLAHSRQECVIFIPVVAILLVARRALRFEDLFSQKAWMFYAALPLAGVPIIWQRILVSAMDPYESDGQPGFALKHFIAHNLVFLKTLGHFDYFLPYATAVNIVAVAGLVFFSDRLVTREIKLGKRAADFSLIALVCVGVYWTIFTSYFRGMMDHPSNARYYTFFFILLSVGASVFLRQLRGRFRIPPSAFLIFAAVMFFVYQSQTAEDRFSRTQSLPREYVFVRDYMKRVEKEKGKNFLLAAERPGLFTIHDYGAVDVGALNSQQIYTDNWRFNLFDDIYVVQDVDDKGVASDSTKLGSRFQLEPLVSLQNIPASFLRISRVKEITADAEGYVPSDSNVPSGFWEPVPRPRPGMSLTRTRTLIRMLAPRKKQQQ